MALETVSKTIDGKLYEFEQFNATKSLKVLSRITRLVGEPILLGVASGYKNAKDKDDKKGVKEPDDALLARAIKELVSRIGQEDDVLSLIKSLCSEGVLCDHQQIVFDIHFAGREGLPHLVRVVKTALEVQYGNFTGALLESVGLAKMGGGSTPA